MFPRRLFGPLALAFALGGCQAPELPRSVDASYGKFLGREPVYVIPNRDWSWTSNRWLFRSSALLRVHVARESEAPLHIELHPETSTARYRLLPSWDGKPLRILRPVEPGEAWRIEIGAGKLTSGLHELRFERDYEADALWVRGAEPETEILEVTLRQADREWTLDPEAMPRYEYLESFLVQGITGLGRTRFGGILAHGPSRWHQEVEAEDALRMEATLENASRRPAAFVASWGDGSPIELRVRPGATRRLIVPAPEPAGPLRIEISGEPDGLFLVGEPFVVRDSRPRQPTIVLVTLDTTRRDAVAPYSRGAPTPHLAAFARTSTVFTRAYSTSPWTLPSHASIFTGLYPGQHGASIEAPHLPYRWETLPEILRGDGYFTAGFAGGFLCHSRFGLGQGMHRYRDPDDFETLGHRLTDSVDEFLDDHPGRPLFLFVNYFDPHAPFQAPDSFAGQLGVSKAAEPLLDRPVWGPLIRGDQSELKHAIQGKGGFDEPVRKYLRAAYDAEIAFMDAQVGRLFERLRAMELWDDAMVIVVADHGELLGEGGYFTHSHRLDPELTEIPLMIKWPGQREARRVDGLVSQVDLFPTVLRAAGIRIPPGQHGRMLHRDRVSDRGRRSVFLEEHATSSHPLFEEMKIADDLYGVQSDDHREILWDEERRCFAREGLEKGWREAPCGDGAGLSLGQLEVLLGRGGERNASPEALTPEDMEALRALGYL